jgi:hypothetical protein
VRWKGIETGGCGRKGRKFWGDEFVLERKLGEERDTTGGGRRSQGWAYRSEGCGITEPTLECRTKKLSTLLSF